jgi:hypothetical protein
MRKCKICEKKIDYRSTELCRSHHFLLIRNGDPQKRQMREKGTGTISRKGYKVFYKNGKHIKEHRYVMEQHLGRKLSQNEHIHHIDGNRLNNNLKNLEIWTTYQPSGQRLSDKINAAKELLKNWLLDRGFWIYGTNEK